MEMVLNNGFCTMTQDEMKEIDGGAGFFAAMGAGIVKGLTAVGGVVGLGPVGAGVLIGACVVAAGVGIYAGCNS